MDDPEQKNTVDDGDSGSTTRNAPQFDNLAVAPEVSSQPVEETIEPAPIVPETKSLHLQKKKGWLVALAVFLVLGAIGGVAWFVIANSKDKSNGELEEASSVGDVDKNGDSDKEPESEHKPEVVTLSLDDELVQKLWGYFNSKFYSKEFLGITENGMGVMSSFAPLNRFYSEEGALSPDGLADVYKFSVAIQAVNSYYDEEAESCKGDYDFLRWVDDTGREHSSVGAKNCYSGDTLRTKVRKIFGSEISLEQFENQHLISSGEGWEYSVKNDEIVNRASGANRSPLARVLLKAEQDGTHVYIYEAVGYVGCWVDGADVCPARKLDGAEVVDGEKITWSNMRDFADRFDNFKWTFTKNADRDYIYSSLEQI